MCEKLFNRKLLPISLYCLMFLGACAGNPPPPPAKGSLASKLELNGNIPYLDVADIRSTRRNGLLVVQVTLGNTGLNSHHFVYRFKWFDRTGFIVGGDEPWKPLPLYNKQYQSINAVAPSPLVEDFRLVVQYPDD
ncbi:MAG: YcfL family protein [Methylococcaceae bacterium]